MAYLVTLLPRTTHPLFSQNVQMLVEGRPRYEGGAVVLTMPKDITPNQPDPLAAVPAEMAWPLELLRAVHVAFYDDPEEDEG
jgi:hypothetical protein